jgi:membrane protease subunit (stomatin/prohibitin family)
MGLMDFIKKQFIDILQWTEAGDGVLAWRYPMQDIEIQYGGQLVVRESQMAVFVNEGKVADVFGPGTHKLTTQTLPVLTYLKNWDKLFESPFKSDVYFFSTRQQIDQRWGTAQPITIRDKDFGAVRLRAFGNYAYRISRPEEAFHTEISRHARDLHRGRPRGPAARADAAAHRRRRGAERHPLPGPGRQPGRVRQGRCEGATAPYFEALGLKLEAVTVQSVSLPEELQKILDQKIGMGMVGNDMGKFMQYQTAQAIPKLAEGVGAAAVAA